MEDTPNILFIMCDQLRYDYLSCYGHPHLQTPNIDRIAEQGVRFTRTYVQSPCCGPSRMSTYTGRYVSTHGTSINFSPLRIDELTLADYMRDEGIRAAVCGKTHIVPDIDMLKRLGLSPASFAWQRRAEGGFEPYYRDDGLYPDTTQRQDTAYHEDLRAAGYDSDNPWLNHVNSSITADGQQKNGWFYESSAYPANVDEYYSETPYTTRKAMDFIRDASNQPWCLHLSYIKPHWPYIVPRPYFGMYGEDQTLPPNRSDGELDNTHPVYQAFRKDRISTAFSRDEVRRAVIPSYMALIKQIDDQIGLLQKYLEENHLADKTIIIFTSDHGDLLGDHWLGEKESFYEESIRLPLIIFDPRPSADSTRGTVCDQLVEAIDLLPTCLDMVGARSNTNRLEGRSLVPFIEGKEVDQWREYVISEIDYSHRSVRESLQVPVAASRSYMIRNARWKYILHEGFQPQLFDLVEDPHEFIDVGQAPEYQVVRDQLQHELFHWIRSRKIRITMSDEKIETMFAGHSQLERGVILGYWSEDELPETFRNSK